MYEKTPASPFGSAGVIGRTRQVWRTPPPSLNLITHILSSDLPESSGIWKRLLTQQITCDKIPKPGSIRPRQAMEFAETTGHQFHER